MQPSLQNLSLLEKNKKLKSNQEILWYKQKHASEKSEVERSYMIWNKNLNRSSFSEKPHLKETYTKTRSTMIINFFLRKKGGERKKQHD